MSTVTNKGRKKEDVSKHKIYRDDNGNVVGWKLNPLAYWDNIEDMPTPSDTRALIEWSDIPDVAINQRHSLKMASYVTTQTLFEFVMGYNPSQIQLDPIMQLVHGDETTETTGKTETGKTGVKKQLKDYPVVHVSYFESIEFCNRLSLILGLQGCYLILDEKKAVTIYWDDEAEGIRLPTEQEWLYCAKANQPYPYAGGSNPNEVAWTAENSNQELKVVGLLKPNKWGLHDMSGLVWEWVWTH